MDEDDIIRFLINQKFSVGMNVHNLTGVKNELYMQLTVDRDKP